MIPRRCPHCQRLVEEAEFHAIDVSVTLSVVPDIAVPGTDADAAHGAVPAT